MPEKRFFRRDTLSSYSKVSYILTVVAVVVEFYIGFSHINDTDAYSRNFATFAILEGFFALTGLLLIDPLRGQGFDVYPKGRFRSITSTTLIVFAITFFLSEFIQIIGQVALTIPDVEFALAIIFASPAEESFFRGFMISAFSSISKSFGFKEYNLSKKIRFSAFEVIGVIISAVAFMSIHTNYYNSVYMLISIFFSGVVYGIAYMISKDLTGIMLAHLLINILYIGQYFWLVNV